MAKTRRAEKKGQHGGHRPKAGRVSLFPGKWENGAPAPGSKWVPSLLGRVAVEALTRKREELSEQEGRPITVNDTIEWCIRKATKTPMDA